MCLLLKLTYICLQHALSVVPPGIVHLFPFFTKDELQDLLNVYSYILLAYETPEVFLRATLSGCVLVYVCVCVCFCVFCVCVCGCVLMITKNKALKCHIVACMHISTCVYKHSTLSNKSQGLRVSGGIIFMSPPLPALRNGRHFL